MGNIKVVHLSPSQWQQYKELRLEALKNEPQAMLTAYEKAKDYSDEEWQSRLEKSSQNIYFAEKENSLAGMTGIKFGEMPKSEHVVTIWGVYVKPEYRGLGVAKKMLQTIMAELDANPKVVKVSLGVVASQIPAYNLYKSLGFREVGVQEKQIYVGGSYYDEILMEKIINHH